MENKVQTPVTRRGRKHLSLIPQPEEIDFAEGVFFKLDNASLSRSSTVEDLKALGKREESETSCQTYFSATSTPCATPPTSWKSTDTSSFILHQPLMVSDPDKDLSETVIDEASALGEVMERSRKLPGTWYFSSNHVMVNQERTKRVIAPLTRLSELDAIAREHAQAMAQASKLFHSDPAQLHANFNRFSRRMGENVAAGASIREIHKEMMKVPTDKHNILHRRYTHFGMGTATGSDGKLYLCQVFRG